MMYTNFSLPRRLLLDFTSTTNQSSHLHTTFVPFPLSASSGKGSKRPQTRKAQGLLGMGNCSKFTYMGRIQLPCNCLHLSLSLFSLRLFIYLYIVIYGELTVNFRVCQSGSYFEKFSLENWAFVVIKFILNSICIAVTFVCIMYRVITSLCRFQPSQSPTRLEVIYLSEGPLPFRELG